MLFVRTNEHRAAAAASIGARQALRERAVLVDGLRSCFARVQTWLQAGKYVNALASELPSRNGWSIAGHCGDRSPDCAQLTGQFMDSTAVPGSVPMCLTTGPMGRASTAAVAARARNLSQFSHGLTGRHRTQAPVLDN